jgi:hypothetical protein
MTEQQWLECSDPQNMLAFLRGKASDRKVRLFAVGCSRRYLHLTRDPRVGEALTVAEQFADGRVRDEERSRARKAAQQAAQVRGVVARPDATKTERRAASLAYYAAARNAMEAAWNVPSLAVEVLVWREGGYNTCDWNAIKSAQGATQSELLRDIFGNPLRRVTIDHAWLAWNDGLVVRLAQAAYEQRNMPEGTLDKSLLAILVDALEEAGCTDTNILGHLRGPGPHARGCWVVDLLLGME